jgi:hypothetical protein
MAAAGRPREAAEMLEKALAAAQGAGDVSGVARALQVLVKADRSAGASKRGREWGCAKAHTLTRQEALQGLGGV